MNFTPRQLVLLVSLTVFWGINWPIMKLGITAWPPLSFRALSMWLGLPVLWGATRLLKVPLTVRRADWPELGRLTLTNMLIWHVIAILSLQSLSSGRAAILGYTMPIFAAVWGYALFHQRLSPRQALGVAAAACGVALLLWHEFGRLAGKPWGAIGMLLAAAAWGLGTQQLRRTRIEVPTLALVWWMSVVTTVVMTVLALAFEHGRWTAPTTTLWAVVGYNAVMIFGFAQPAWMMLARALPPVASSLSVQMIPVIGVVSGAWWLGEALHWQDGAALLLTGVAIGSVLWPSRGAAPPAPSAASPPPDPQRAA